jgi:hypothetical protein
VEVDANGGGVVVVPPFDVSVELASVEPPSCELPPEPEPPDEESSPLEEPERLASPPWEPS